MAESPAATPSPGPERPVRAGETGPERPRRAGEAGPEPPRQVGEPGFGGKQVLAIVGITYRQLDHWARTDLLRPSLCDAKGSGSRRRYSYDDVVQLKVIKKLLDGGQSLQAARKVIERLRVEGEDVGSAQLVIAGDSVALARDREELVDLLRGGQGVLSIFLEVAGVRKEVDAAIDSLLQLDAADGQDNAGGQDEAASLAAG